MTAPAELRPLSVSQYNSFKRCGYAWYLDRVLKAWNRPAAWLPQGSAVHTVLEHIELRKLAGTPLSLQEAQEMFGEEYSKEVGQYTEHTPNFDWWFASGPYRGAQDVERRYTIGLGQIEKYLSRYEQHPGDAIWVAEDGTPGIELGFDIELDGLRVRGFIDQVIVENGNLLVRDHKTGNMPGDDFQLGVYALAIAEKFGVEQPAVGDYFMAKTGKPTYPYDLTGWTRERIVGEFRDLDENIKAERFEPKPDPKVCNFCSVNFSCEFSAA